MNVLDRKHLILASFVGLFSIGAHGLAAEGRGVTEEDMARLERGRQIFHERCALCHGFDGVPELPEAPNFAEGERLDKSDEELLKAIRHGKDVMPAWKDVLSEDEMYEVLLYARVIMGDVTFQDKCIGCHEKAVAPLSGDIPADDKLPEFKGPFDICGGCNIEREMSREEIISVIKFLRTLAGEK